MYTKWNRNLNNVFLMIMVVVLTLLMILLVVFYFTDRLKSMYGQFVCFHTFRSLLVAYSRFDDCRSLNATYLNVE